MASWQSVVTVLATPTIAVGVWGGVAQSSFASTVNVSCLTETSNAPEVVISAAQHDTTKQVTMLTFMPEYFPEQDAVQKCESTASSLQQLYSESEGSYLASDTLLGLPTVCSVERRGMGCDSYGAKVLFTLSAAADPSQALYDMLGSNFKQAERPDPRTVSRIYTKIDTHSWWPF